MKLRQQKKSRGGKTLIFLFLAIVFVSLSGYLISEVIHKMNELSQVKLELNRLEVSNADFEKDAQEIKLKEKEIENEARKLEQRLEEIKKAHPNAVINLEGNNEKYAYLTFDDGPSKNTAKILDFLKENHIKATFFVIGDAARTDMYKRIVDEGHTLGVHSNTHKYNEIYLSVYSFMKDINDLSNLLEQATGRKPSVLRFPGGSNNSISKKYSGFDIMNKIIPEVQKEGYAYFDWNVDSADAAKSNQNPAIIANTVLNQTKDKEYAVILMHDAAAKATTVEALPTIVQGLRKQGFTFKELTSESEPIHFR